MRRSSGFARWGFPIRKSSGQRLLGTSPKLIAATPRPSSPLRVKASTIRPYSHFLEGNVKDHNYFLSFFDFNACLAQQLDVQDLPTLILVKTYCAINFVAKISGFERTEVENFKAMP